MPNFNSSSNYGKNNSYRYNLTIKPTEIVYIEDKQPYPYTPQNIGKYITNFDISGTVSVNDSFNPQIEDSGLRWI